MGRFRLCERGARQGGSSLATRVQQPRVGQVGQRAGHAFQVSSLLQLEQSSKVWSLVLLCGGWCACRASGSWLFAALQCATHVQCAHQSIKLAIGVKLLAPVCFCPKQQRRAGCNFDLNTCGLHVRSIRRRHIPARQTPSLTIALESARRVGWLERNWKEQVQFLYVARLLTCCLRFGCSCRHPSRIQILMGELELAFSRECLPVFQKLKLLGLHKPQTAFCVFGSHTEI